MQDKNQRDERVEVEQLKIEIGRVLHGQEQTFLLWIRTMPRSKRLWLLSMADEDLAEQGKGKASLRLVSSS